MRPQRLGQSIVIGVALATAWGLASCRKAESDAAEDGAGEGDETTSKVTGIGGDSAPGDAATPLSGLPQVGGIALGGLGGAATAAALGLQDGETCHQDKLGVMGFALGGACNTAPFAAKIMLGNRNGDHDADGDMDCDDLVAATAKGSAPGLLLHLLCEDVMRKNDGIVSLAFAGPETAFGVSFKDFPNDTAAVGAWTQGDAASYPADIRIFKGRSLPTLKGHMALTLIDRDNGSVKIAGFGTPGDERFSADLSFSNKRSTAKCATMPDTANCHWQDVRLYGGEAAIVSGPPNGFHLKILADDKEKPSFIAIEGKYRYTDATAEAQFPAAADCPGAELRKLRSLYFQTVQKGTQIWGRFQFKDRDGHLLACEIAPGLDPFAMMARPEGVCQNAGSDQWVPCTAITPGEYTERWQGELNFADVTESPVGDIFDDAPTTVGVCTTAGCSETFKAGEEPQ